jgi:hypothetical protein
MSKHRRRPRRRHGKISDSTPAQPGTGADNTSSNSDSNSDTNTNSGSGHGGPG